MRQLGEESDLVLFHRFHFCFRVADLVLSGRCLTLRLAHFFQSDLSAHLLAPRCGKQTATQLCTGRSKAEMKTGLQKHQWTVLKFLPILEVSQRGCALLICTKFRVRAFFAQRYSDPAELIGSFWWCNMKNGRRVLSCRAGCAVGCRANFSVKGIC